MTIKKQAHSFVSVTLSIFLIFAQLLIPLPLATTAAGNTYYVAKSGSDSNSGTETQSFLTIQKALDLVGPGDTVIVKSGTYSQESTAKTSGTSTAPITIRADGVVKVT